MQVGEALGGIVDLIDGIVTVTALCRRLTSLKRLCCLLWVLHLDGRRRQDESLKSLGRLVGVNALMRLGRVVRIADLVLQRRVVLHKVLVQLIVGLGAVGTLLTGLALILLLWLLDEGLLHLLREGRCLAVVGLLVLLDLLSVGVLLLQRGQIPIGGIVGTVCWTTTGQQCLELGNDLQMEGQLSDVGLWHRLKLLLLLLLLLGPTEHNAEGIGEGIASRQLIRLTLGLALGSLGETLRLRLNPDLLLILEQLQDRPEQVELLLSGVQTWNRRWTGLHLVKMRWWLLLLLLLLHHHHWRHVQLPARGGLHGLLEVEGGMEGRVWGVGPAHHHAAGGSRRRDGGRPRRTRSPGHGVAAGAVAADVVAGTTTGTAAATTTDGGRRSGGRRLGPGLLPLGPGLLLGPLGALLLLPLVLAIVPHLGLVPDGVLLGHGLVPLELGDANVLPPFGDLSSEIAERYRMLGGRYRLLPFHGVERSGLGGILGLSLAFALALGG